MRFSEYQADKLAAGPEDLPAPGPLVYPKKCLRTVPAREWVHGGWMAEAAIVAAWCLRVNPKCEKCREVLGNYGRGGL